MLFFTNDYSEGAHEKVLQRLIETNMEQLPGYGSDCYCESAREKIRAACECPDAEIFFLGGGTQTNAVVIDALLQPYEGVVAAVTGHISVHEAGAIEYTGHKVIEVQQHLGKIIPEDLVKCMENFWNDETHEHMVFPGMVYISHPTEYGTLYTKAELEALSAVCKKYNLPLYMDGARMGYGLMAEGTDVTLPVIASCCDAFYIGGTKVGALCGEAVVFTGAYNPKYFMTRMKQHGALFAKGRVLGVQFDTLFTDNLYMDIAKHAIEMAKILKQKLLEKGYTLFIDSPTNQQFVVMENEKLKELEDKVVYSFWENVDENHTVIRFATSWATKEEDIDKLMELL